MSLSYETRDPASGQLIKSFDLLDRDALSAKIAQSEEALLTWRDWTLIKRAAIFYRMADDLTKNAVDYARLMQLEMGKPVAEGEAEVKKCAWVCQYFADNAATFLLPKERLTEASCSFVRYDPLGIILAIMPWNFPFWQVFRVLAPTLMAGNVLLLKHAANTPQCALTIEKMFLTAGGIPGALSSIFVSHNDVLAMIADHRIKGVTLTGSNAAGSNVAKSAGEHLKPCVMELGGSDPFIVFDDADIALAAKTGAASRLINSGQSCVNAKRFLVCQSIVEPFTEALIKGMESSIIGPLATARQRDMVHEQVTDALDKGARLLLGGTVPGARGFFYPLTVITNVNNTMRLWHEEVFGPVATIIPFDNDDEALAIANGSVFGLGSAIWTHNAERIDRFCRDLECGAVFVNDLVKSDPRLPFGGIKQSGFGRELGEEGIKSFVNAKTVWIRD